jgi:hypothetical protein
MRRKLLIALLALGTVGGFGSGIASLSRGCRSHHERRAAFERHVADVCTEAAFRARDRHPGERPPPDQREARRGRHHHHDWY